MTTARTTKPTQADDRERIRDTYRRAMELEAAFHKLMAAAGRCDPDIIKDLADSNAACEIGGRIACAREAMAKLGELPTTIAGDSSAFALVVGPGTRVQAWHDDELKKGEVVTATVTGAVVRLHDDDVDQFFAPWSEVSVEIAEQCPQPLPHGTPTPGDAHTLLIELRQLQARIARFMDARGSWTA